MNGGAIVTDSHPLDRLLRADRLPHIWCPGCGLGVATGAFVEAMEESGTPIDRHVVVSGIGCTGRVAGYLDVDSFHTAHGRAIPFATGLKIARPDLQVTVFSGDGDLFAIGGNHFIHAARRNLPIHVICINNFNYGRTGGQSGPTTPRGAFSTTSPYGVLDHAFNLPQLAAAVGAVFVARWTTLHIRQLKASIKRSFQKEGFTFIEVLAPCPVSFGRPNDLGEGVDEMSLYRDHGELNPTAALDSLDLQMKRESSIVVGTFVDTDKPRWEAQRID
ncbi:MAG: 2-oxoacid:ferredoxin oxidoreductase subunit beta [Chloroflexi bacterium]|nr:2-oxoacid:ferredoxin oxidoreductase subunit beta [Chloroflexota bacterium]